MSTAAAPSPRPASGVLTALAFAIVYVGWGSTFLAVRVAVSAFPPFFVGAFRNLVAGVVMVAAGLAFGAGWPSSSALWRALAVGCLMFVANHGGISWASTRNPSGITALLVATIPLWIVAIEWGRGRSGRLSARSAWGLALGFVGSVLLFWPASGAPRLDLLASLVTTCAAVSWATGTLVTRRAAVSQSVHLATGLPMVFGGAVLAAISLGTGEWQALHAATIPWPAMAALAYLVVLGSLIGFTAYVYLLRTNPASRVATYAYVNPVVALALGAGLGGEVIGPTTLIAAAVSLVGVYLSVSDR